jgi:glutathione synthase/RimK-type ligase-like ATP-grasp enzyme
VSDVEVLVVSTTSDYTSDYVCLELDQRKTNYLRINRDEFLNYTIIFDISSLILSVKINGETYIISEPRLKSIYYRAPIYLRDIYQPELPAQMQLFRTQWAAFVRNLTVFEKPLWINNPIATYKAENKILQLKYAQMVGLTCPSTYVTNTCPPSVINNIDYIVKSLDTAVLRIDGHEAFVYSNKISGKEIESAQLSLAPVIIQNYIQPKIDLRVTVIGESLYCVKILSDGQGVEGDWRQKKDHVEFIECQLPLDISQSCIDLVKSLGLCFGAIDLIQSNNAMYFLEINPTGEWGWLVQSAGLPIHKTICNYLELGCG